MSRRFTFALIAIVLAQFCAVYVWQQHERKEELAVITASMTASHEMAIAGQEKLLEVQIWSYKELMRDDAKVRFMPLSHFVTQNYAAYQALVESKDEHTFQEASIAFIEAVSADFEATLMTHHASISLREENARRRCSETLALKVVSQNKLAEISNNLPPALQSDMMRIITLDYLRSLLLDAMILSSSYASGFYEYFPVFSSERCAYQRGDTLRAIVSVGSYSNLLYPENVKLTVNGQELKMLPDGRAEFNAPAGGLGEHTLETKVVVTNPLTGEVKTGEGRFHYRVE